ncbi:hypothetical protein BG005_002140 [Podila minutissima]|nr:hypothetical protein BG005_002140 [Podila minutissima]
MTYLSPGPDSPIADAPEKTAAPNKVKQDLNATAQTPLDSPLQKIVHELVKIEKDILAEKDNLQ